MFAHLLTFCFVYVQLAEVTADLSEEHNTAHLAGERLEAEQAERMKLEKEVERLQVIGNVFFVSLFTFQQPAHQ